MKSTCSLSWLLIIHNTQRRRPRMQLIRNEVYSATWGHSAVTNFSTARITRTILFISMFLVIYTSTTFSL